MAKNNLAARIAAQKEAEKAHCMEIVSRFGRWAQQASLDALEIVLARGDAMHGKFFGPERIAEFSEEWAKVLGTMVMLGISERPDADAWRAKVDSILKEEVPEGFFVPWEERYIGWQTHSLEEEVTLYREDWKKQGKIPKNSDVHDYVYGKEKK